VRQCNAREAIDLTFRVPYFVSGASGALVCEVESDMPFVSGSDTIQVPAKGEAEYVLRMKPQLGGSYTGSVTFKAPGGEFLWYTMEVQVDSPLHERSIDMRAEIRKVVSAEISLENPLDEVIDFRVELQGHGVLGDNTFSLGPRATGAYSLYYSPLTVQEHSGSVAFLNDRVGEFWYKLNLYSEAAPPVELDPLSAPVGTKTTVPLTVENPLAEEVVITGQVSNRTNFAINPAVVQVPPYGQATVDLEYVPSSLQEVEATEVALTCPKLGDWLYMAEGRGELPGVMPEHFPEATVGDAMSYMLQFRNPFRQQLSLDIVLSSAVRLRADTNGVWRGGLTCV